jgi:hypothetical protein
MTSLPWPSSRPSAPAAALIVAIGLLLCLPASSVAGGDVRAAGSQAERGESSETALTSADLLARGSGYGTQNGSRAVRELQLRLRRLGHRPGPIDGLFGPLTEASVERFQRARGLQVDGVVGPRTRARLVALTARRPAAPHGSATPKASPPDHPAPNRPAPADVAPPRQAAPDAAQPVARAPESSDGPAPWLAALLGALATAVLFAGLSRLRRPRSGERAPERRAPAPGPPRSRLHLGLAFAVLLGVFAVGAAIGALFATHAAPGDRDRSEVAGGALLSPPEPSRIARPAEPPPTTRRARSPRRPRPAGIALPPAPPDTSKSGDQGAAPATGGSASSVTARPRPDAPVEKADAPVENADAPVGKADTPVEKADAPVEKADAAVARRVRRPVDLNLEERIAGDPGPLTLGEPLGAP